MTLHVIYESAAGTTTDLATADHVRLGLLDVTQEAEEATPGHSQLPIEDVGGTLSLVGWKRLWLWESAESAGNQVIGTFYITDRRIGRATSSLDPQVVSADRWWNTGLVDHNVNLQQRIVSGADGDRPAETDIARLTWLLSSGYAPNVNNTGGYINNSGAVSLDKADLRGQKAYDVVAECANQSDKNFHLIPNSPTTSAGAASYSLWYDYDFSAAYRSTLRLTNVLADVDNAVTFAVDPDMVLRRTPERVYSGVLVRYNGGEVYAQKTATGNAFAFRDAVHHAINLNTASAASSRATRYLNDADSEEDRITCRFVVPKERVNDLREGHACEIKFSHLPSYTDWSWARCLRRTVRQLSDEFYEIQVELVQAPSGSLTTTTGQLMRPYTGTGGAAYQGGGIYHIYWQRDGDNPQAGDDGGALPLVGLIEYVGSQPDRTGLRVLGDGLVSVRLAFDVAKVTGSAFSFTATVRVNGAIVATDSRSFNGPLGTHTATWGGISGVGTELTATNIAVRSGDVIEGWVVNSLGDEVSALPTGVGNSAHWLIVTGSLKA